MRISALTDLINSPFFSLNNVYRFSNTHIIERETTAEHTIVMQLIAMYMYNKEPGIDIKDICMRCLYHDLDEGVLADIPRSVKYIDDTVHDIFEKVAESLLEQNEVSEGIRNSIKNSKHDGTIEGCFVQVLDTLQCCIKLYFEKKLQNTSIIIQRFNEAMEVLQGFIGEYKDKVNNSDNINNDKRLNIDSYRNCLDIFQGIYLELRID